VEIAEVAVLTFFGLVLAVLAVIDFRTRRLPNRIVLPAAAVVLVAQIAIVLGAALGWAIAAALAIGLLAAAVAAVGVIVYEGWSARTRMIPLGPFLAPGGRGPDGPQLRPTGAARYSRPGRTTSRRRAGAAAPTGVRIGGTGNAAGAPRGARSPLGSS